MSSEYGRLDEAQSHRAIYSELSSEDPSAQSSANPSRPPSAAGDRHPLKRGRVRFNSTSEANDGTNRRSNIPALDDLDIVTLESSQPSQIKPSPTHSRSGSSTGVLRKTTPEHERRDPFADGSPGTASPVLKPRPNLLHKGSASYDKDDGRAGINEEKVFSALAAQERAQRIASLVGSHSAPSSRRNSVDDNEEGIDYPRAGGTRGYPVRVDDIPLMDMDSRRTYDGAGYDTDDDLTEQTERPKQSSTSEAHKLVRAHTRKLHSHALKMPADPAPGLVSGQVTPTEERHFHEDYVPRPEQYRGGVLSSLLKLYNAPNNNGSHARHNSDTSASPSYSHPASTPGSAGSSGTNTPKTKHQKWYKQQHRNQSQDTLVGLIEASNMLGAHAAAQGTITPKKGPTRPGAKRTSSGNIIGSAMQKITKPKLEDEIRITIHIAETLSRQKYLLKLCRALMSYGAPTHRLEEYMKMSARVLEIDGQFLYMPGCMIISFDDASTHTTEVKLVRAAQGVDLGKLKDIHEVYKEVVHDVIGVEEATQRLDMIIQNKQKNHAWALVFVYGLASACVAPFAFEGRLIDLPIAFILGSILGFLQLIVAPKSDLYSNVFEISAAVFTSFLARAFGSISGGDLFCFSALAQSSIALILPGYMVLCGSLELQSKSMVAGSVRMVYAIIYSLFLGFGITVGTAFYGLMDPNATSATTCSNPLPGYWKWCFVPAFTLCLAIINQAKWKQMPVMLVISFAGYIVNFFSAQKFPSSPQISNTFGALVVGVLGNLYSRVRHGVAAAALLPAIFVQVPSGLAASGSLLAGLNTADQITNSMAYANGTLKGNGTNQVPITSSTDLNTIVFNVGYSMIQVAIGITVGLFLSALIVYPLGKRRSGLFSF